MQTIEATYRIVTPMFIGGANQDPSDGIRPPSFKGALRFWWRALNWGKFYQEAQGDEAKALKALHKKECKLFGSAVKGKEGGQGVFLLKIKQPSSFQTDQQWPQAKPLKSSGYLGMGLWESGSKENNNLQTHRVSIISKTTFTVSLALKKGIDNEDVEQLCQALKAIGLVGGLGSRSRRGFGSIAIESLQGDSFVYHDKEAYVCALESFFGEHQGCDLMPPYTAWSECSRVGLLQQSAGSAKDIHKKAAELFYRVRGLKAEVRGTNKRGFGQPLPLKPMKPEYDKRRASSLFFHVHPVGNQFVCSHVFMPAQFLPDEGYDMNFFSGVTQYMNHLQEVSL